MEKISIIVPVFNQELYLESCLNSIQKQTFSNIEVLLVDDGSTDKSGEICDLFSKNDFRFISIHIKNSGVAVARNIGLEHVTGDLIGFVDPDDWIDINMYQQLFDNYLNFSADIVCCGFFEDEFELNNNSNDNILICNREESMKLLSENTKVKSHLWNKMFKKELFDGLRFEENRVYEDVWILHQVFDRANKFVFFDKKLYFYRPNMKSIVRSVSLLKQIDYCYALKCRYEYMQKKYPQYIDNVLVCFKYEVLSLVDVSAKSNMQEIYKSYNELLDIFFFYNAVSDSTTTTKEKLLKFNVCFTLLIYKVKFLLKS